MMIHNPMARKLNIILIAAIGKHRELGKGADLLWRISDDLKRFKALTNGFPIVMGRKTFVSIGKALPGRANIIVTRNLDFRHDGVVVAHSIEKAFEVGASMSRRRLDMENGGKEGEKIFVIGGGEIYKAALPYATRLELTLVDAENADADVFFPEFESNFKKVSEEEPREESGIRYTWAAFERK